MLNLELSSNQETFITAYIAAILDTHGTTEDAVLSEPDYQHSAIDALFFFEAADLAGLDTRQLIHVAWDFWLTRQGITPDAFDASLNAGYFDGTAFTGRWAKQLALALPRVDIYNVE